MRTLFSSLLAIALAAPTTTLAQHVSVVINDYKTPTSLDKAYSESVVTVLGRVTNVTEPVFESPLVVRYYDLAIDEVFKSDRDVPLRTSLRVRHLGGTLQVEKSEWIAPYTSKPPRRGDRVVVFLVREGGSYLALAGGKTSLVIDTSGNTRAPESMRAREPFNGKPLVTDQDVILALRTLREASTRAR